MLLLICQVRKYHIEPISIFVRFIFETLPIFRTSRFRTKKPFSPLPTDRHCGQDGGWQVFLDLRPLPPGGAQPRGGDNRREGHAPKTRTALAQGGHHHHTAGNFVGLCMHCTAVVVAAVATVVAASTAPAAVDGNCSCCGLYFCSCYIQNILFRSWKS